MNWILIVELLLGSLALVVGIWHLVELRRSVKKLRELSASAEKHLATLKLIQTELTTQPIGQFPKYLGAITELLEQAKDKIVILCDFPAYGSFSAHHDFVGYRQVIERKIDSGVKVEVTYLEHRHRIKLLHEQFSDAESDWKSWRDKPENTHRIQTIQSSQGLGDPISKLKFEEFVKLLEKENDRVLEETFVQAEKQEKNAHIPIYFWIADDSSAIFSIPSYSKRAVEHGYKTFDRNLIIGFNDLRQRFLNIT